MAVALMSAFHKGEPLAEFARGLRKRGWDILASAGTTKFLAEHGVEAADVAGRVGEPILGHRVVTLSREIYAALLSRPEDEAEMTRLGIRPIDLVYVDLYPLAEEIARPGATEESILEKTDIGGPTLLRAAGKGRRIALTDSAQFSGALQYIDAREKLYPTARRRYLAGLAAEAEAIVADYCAASRDFNRRAASGELA